MPSLITDNCAMASGKKEMLSLMENNRKKIGKKEKKGIEGCEWDGKWI